MEQILPGSCREGREVHSNNVYTVSKCQNGKILKKENLVYIHTGVLLSHKKNNGMWLESKWMQL
jgi:hypothetical protein